MKSVRLNAGGVICIMSFPDEIVELKAGPRTYTMEFCKSLGPKFYFKNGNPYYPSKRAPVWKAFGEWMKKNNLMGNTQLGDTQ